MVILIVITIPLTMNDTKNDVKGVYSYGEETVKYIIDNLEENSVILLDYDEMDPLIISLVEPYRKDIVFYDTAHGRPHTVHLLSEYYVFDPEYILYAGDEVEADYKYYLCRKNIQNKNFKLVYSNYDLPTIGNEEHFNLYLLINK